MVTTDNQGVKISKNENSVFYKIFNIFVKNGTKNCKHFI